MNRYAFFLGCTIPARSRNYEMSARAVARKLGLEMVDIADFGCCGFPMKASDQEAAALLAARNLSLADAADLDICTLCSACASMLGEEAHRLSHDSEHLAEVNRRLAGIDRSCSGNVKVKHFAHVLMEESGLERLRENVTVDLKDLPVAVHYGCHYLKPSDIYPEGDDPEIPVSLERLIEAVGARPVEYARKTDCCGGAVLVADELTALSMAKAKLDHVKAAGARAMCVVCPFCSVMYDDNQKSIEARFEVEYRLPVLFLPQLIGLALGLDRKELGLNMNVVKTKQLTGEILGTDD